jgi:hypothetical protein
MAAPRLRTVARPIGSFANTKIPSLARPNHDFGAAESLADSLLMPSFDDADIVSPPAPGAREEYGIKNAEGIYQKAKQRGMIDEDNKSPFSHTPAYQTHSPVAIPGPGGVPSHTPKRVHVSKMNGMEMLESMYGREMAEAISRGFIGRNQPGQGGLLNGIHHKGAEYQLNQLPTYMMRGDFDLPDADGIFMPEHRVMYWNRHQDAGPAGPFGMNIPKHEATHALTDAAQRMDEYSVDGVTPPLAELLGDGNYMRYAEHSMGKPLSGRQGDNLRHDLENRYGDEGGVAEVLADLLMFSRESGLVRGTTDRSRGFLHGLLDDVGSTPYKTGPDPTYMIGPNKGQEATGFHRLRNSVKGVLDSVPAQGKDLMYDGIYRGSSVNRKPRSVYG